jgi:hypothetical protein
MQNGNSPIEIKPFDKPKKNVQSCTLVKEKKNMRDFGILG